LLRSFARSAGSTADDIRLSGVVEVARHVNIRRNSLGVRSSEFCLVLMLQSLALNSKVRQLDIPEQSNNVRPRWIL